MHLPPLRERKEDIPLLVDHFLEVFGHLDRPSTIHGKIGKVMEALFNFNWPGNVRELQNALHCYLTTGRLDFIHYKRPGDRTHFDVLEKGFIEDEKAFRSVVDFVERSMISKALKMTRNNRSKAAGRLGIPKKTLYRKMEKFGIVGQGIRNKTGVLNNKTEKAPVNA